MLVNCPCGFTRKYLLILVHEALDAAFGVHQLVLAREERMAIGANFDLDVRFGRARFDHVAASAADGGFG